MSDRPSDSVETVLGPVPLSALGKTLTHEHIICNFCDYYMTPEQKLWKEPIPFEPLTIKNRGFLKLYPYSNMYNLILNDKDAMLNCINELQLFKMHGGKTILENSCIGLHRNLDKLKLFSEMSAINIIFGTGFYKSNHQQMQIETSEETLYKLMYEHLTKYCLTYKMKPGFIGEMKSSWPITDMTNLPQQPNIFITYWNLQNYIRTHEQIEQNSSNIVLVLTDLAYICYICKIAYEEHSIRATGTVQSQLHCPVIFSPGTDKAAPYEIMRIYQEAGGDSRKAVMSHLDHIFSSTSDLMLFADDCKCYIQFSSFGTECSINQCNPDYSILSDAQRIKRIKEFKREKRLNRVLISHDIRTKNRLTYFGGHGYSHILRVTKHQMLERNLNMDDFNMLMEENPKTWLSSVKN